MIDECKSCGADITFEPVYCHKCGMSVYFDPEKEDPLHGLTALEKFANHVRCEMYQDKDWWIFFEGYPGMGKSTQGIWLAAYAFPDLFSIENNICYDPDDFLEKVDKLPRFSPLLFDEAGSGWNGKAHATKVNLMLSNASQEMRDRNLMVELMGPKYTILDKHGRYRVKNLVTVPKRGVSKWKKVLWPEYGDTDFPYTPTMFRYRFFKLPDPIDAQYREFKTTKGRERMQRYREEIMKERGLSNETVPEDILLDLKRKGLPDDYRTRMGRIDKDAVMVDYKVSEPVARQACILIRRHFSDEMEA